MRATAGPERLRHLRQGLAQASALTEGRADGAAVGATIDAAAPLRATPAVE